MSGIGTGRTVPRKLALSLLQSLAAALALAIASPAMAQAQTYDDAVDAYLADDHEGALAIIDSLLAQPEGTLTTAEQVAIRSSRGIILEAVGRMAEALADHEAAYALGLRELGADDVETLSAQYSLAMFHDQQGDYDEARRLLEDHNPRRFALLGIAPIWDVQRYDADGVYHLLTLADLRVATGDVEAGLSLLLGQIHDINIAVNDMTLRSAYLDALVNQYSLQGRLAELADEEELAEFVSRSTLHSDFGDALFGQIDLQRRILEEAGRPDEARAVALLNPYWVEQEFTALVDQDQAAAYSLLEQALDATREECTLNCAKPAVHRYLLELKIDVLDADGRAREALPVREELVRFNEADYGLDPTILQASYDGVARAYADLGMGNAALEAQLRAGGLAADPDLDGNIELTIARRLREAGAVERADEILTGQVACAFPQTDSEFGYNSPCSSAYAAMAELAALEAARGDDDEAEYYRLPQEIVTAYRNRDDDTAQAKADRLIDVAFAVFPQDADRQNFAMSMYRSVHDWWDIPTYDLPRERRICGRWDEPEPEPAPAASGDDDALPMPTMMSVSSPRSSQPEERYFSFNSYNHVSPQDRRGAAYHALSNRQGMTFEQYALQCAAVGNLAGGIDFADWALGLTSGMGYSVSDQERLWLLKSDLELAADRYRDAEASLLTVVDPYLAGTDESSEMFNTAQAFERLIRLYGDLGRGDSLFALLTRMRNSELFADRSGSDQALRPVREALYLLHLARGEYLEATELLDTLGPYEAILAAQSRGLDERDLAELIRRERTAYALRYVDLEVAAGNYDAALEILDRVEAENDAFLAEYMVNPDAPANAVAVVEATFNGQVHGQRGGIFAKQGRWAEALAELEASGIFAYGEVIFEAISESFGGEVNAETLAAAMAEDERMQTLLSGLRGSYATAAEMAMRAGEEDKALEYSALARMFPASNRWGVVEQQSLWASVSLGIARPELRTRSLADAELLVAGLERQWNLASRNTLDASQLREMLAMAPTYFGDVLSLEWVAQQEQGHVVDEARAFRLQQWSIMSVVDLTIAQSAARSSISGADDDFADLLTERDLLARTLYDNPDRPQDASALDFVQQQAAREQAAARLESNLQRLREIEAQIEAEHPDFYEITSSEPVDLDEARRLLGPDEAVLLIAPVRSGTHLMLLTDEGLTWHQAGITDAEIAVDVARLRYFLGANAEATSAQQDEWNAQVDGGWQGFDRDTAHRLYQQFIEPFAGELSGRNKLYVSPGGALSALPLSVLVSEIAPGRDDDPDSLRATTWLIDEFALTQIPSLRSFSLLREQQDEDDSGQIDFLGVGDPVLQGEAIDRSMRSVRGETTAAAAVDVAEVWDGSQVNLERLRQMSRLEGTSQELQNMQTAFGANAQSLLLGPAATETRLRQTNLADYDVIAFATHGLMAGQLFFSSEPGLVMTPPERASATDDGYLAASEVAALRLSADWVILSACNTASSDGTLGAPALSGLARSFFHAGARGLLVSHWYVRDDVAANLTVLAINARRDNGSLSRAEALQQAVRNVRMDTRADGRVRNRQGVEVENSWAHPNAWAPFTLISGS